WLDPLNAKLAAHAFADRLAQLDAPNAKLYRDNAAAFDARIDKKLAQWQAQMAPYKGTKIASYHATFNYFHRRFGLESIGYTEDRPGIPPSPAHLVELIRQMRAEGAGRISRVVLRPFDLRHGRATRRREGARAAHIGRKRERRRHLPAAHRLPHLELLVG